MAVRILENEYLRVEIADDGAELSRVLDKETGVERLHDANPQVWNRHAPILFPIVGSVIDGVYRIGGQEYEMKTQHGFARDSVFECIQESKNSVTHRLLPTEDMLAHYPYSFELLVTHLLTEEEPRLLQVKWEVKNHGNTKMYYGIGGHPGFTTPEKDALAKESYFIEFVGQDSIEYFGVNEESGFLEPWHTKRIALENGFLPFCEEIYMTLIFDRMPFSKVRICRPDKTPYVTMDCSGFSSFGVWAKKAGNFICLEPWNGRGDDHGFTGTLDEKFGIRGLEAGEGESITHTIEFHK